MGRVYKPKYGWTKADGTRIDKVTTAWYVEFTDASGRCVRRKAGLTKEQAQDALRKAESDVLSEKNGLPTQRTSDITFTELLNDYLIALRQRATLYYADRARKHIQGMLSHIRVVRVGDLKPHAVEQYLSGLAAAGLAANSINAPLIAMKALLNWAVETRRLPFNPMACVKRVTGEPRRVRRALSEDEISRLLAAGLDGPVRRHRRIRENRPRKDGSYKRVDIPLSVQVRLAGEGRNMVLAYRLMIEAGLRLNEARLLRWHDLDLDIGVMRLRAETRKTERPKSCRCPQDSFRRSRAGRPK